MNATCPNGTCGDCLSSLPLPIWLPEAIGAGLACLVGLGLFIYYFVSEQQKRNEDERWWEQKLLHESEEDKEDRDAFIHGSTNQQFFMASSPPAAGGTRRSNVRILQRSRRPKTRLHFVTPVPISAPQISELRGLTVTFHIRVLSDRTNRALELMDLINATEVPLTASSEEKAIFLLDAVKNRIESMTESKCVVHGRLDKNAFYVRAAEDVDPGDLRLEMTIQCDSPIHLEIFVYTVHMVQEVTALFTPHTNWTTSSKEVDRTPGSTYGRNIARITTDGLEKLHTQNSAPPAGKLLPLELKHTPRMSIKSEKKKLTSAKSDQRRKDEKTNLEMSTADKGKPPTKGKTPMATETAESRMLQPSRVSFSRESGKKNRPELGQATPPAMTKSKARSSMRAAETNEKSTANTQITQYQN